MNKKLYSILLTLAMTASCLPMTPVKADSGSIKLSRGTNYKYPSYGCGSHWNTHKYGATFTDEDGESHSASAYCIDPNAQAPSSGTYDITTLTKGSMLAKVMYWGDATGNFAGSDNFYKKHHTDWSAGRKWIVTHLACGLAVYGRGHGNFTGTNSSAMSWAREVYDYAEKMGDMPRAAFHINQAGELVVESSAEGEGEKLPTKITDTVEERLTKDGFSKSFINKVDEQISLSRKCGQRVRIKAIGQNSTSTYKIHTGAKNGAIILDANEKLVEIVPWSSTSTKPIQHDYWIYPVSRAADTKGTSKIKFVGSNSVAAYKLTKRDGKQDLATIVKATESATLTFVWDNDTPEENVWIEIKKTDGNNQPMNGCTFTVFKDSELKTKIKNFPAFKDGVSKVQLDDGELRSIGSNYCYIAETDMQKTYRKGAHWKSRVNLALANDDNNYTLSYTRYPSLIYINERNINIHVEKKELIPSNPQVTGTDTSTPLDTKIEGAEIPASASQGVSDEDESEIPDSASQGVSDENQSENPEEQEVQKKQASVVPHGNEKVTYTWKDGDPLVDAVYGLYSNMDDLTLGDKTYDKGDIIAWDTTDANGNINFNDIDGLRYASYYVQEIQAPDGHALDPAKYAFTLNKDDIETDLVLQEISVKDRGIVIGTSVRDMYTNEKISPATKAVKLEDRVTYAGLNKGESYTLKGTLMDKATKKAVVDGSGKEVTGTTNFTAAEDDGIAYVTFEFDASNLQGHEVVVYEELVGKKQVISDEGKISSSNEVLAEHKDINDAGQTIKFPDIHTTLIDNETKEDRSYADEEVTLTDTVTYKNLKPGKEYKMSGVLMDKESGEKVLDKEGKEITSSVVFTPDKAEGTVEIPFKFDGSLLKGKAVVAFETVSDNYFDYATHADIKDEDQTDYFPEIQTSIMDKQSETNLCAPSKEITLIDTVSYKNLKKGHKYTMTGKLMNKETGEPVLDDEGKEVVSEPSSFTAEDSEGTTDVVFTFSGEKLAGTTMVCFEELRKEDILYATHTDIEDEAQTIYVPDIKTQVIDQETGTQASHPDEEITIIDTVSYKNLLPNKEYTMKGKLMDKDTKEPALDDDGKEIVAETTFTPTEPTGTVKVKFVFKGAKHVGKQLVAFEDLEYNGNNYATHADLEDEAQTIYLPEIHTTAKGESKTSSVFAEKDTKIIDTIAYKNLAPNVEYTIRGTLMDKSSGKAILDAAGKEIKAEGTFTPTEKDGTTDITFTFDGSNLEGKTAVVFEKLFIINTVEKEEEPADEETVQPQEEAIVAEHEDIKDVEQTVYFPKIRTSARDASSDLQMTYAGKKAVIVDTVSYQNLVPDTEYIMKGTLMDKTTGKPAKTKNGKEIAATAKFTPKDASGSTKIRFTFNATGLEGLKSVVFEKLFVVSEKYQVAKHENINDKEQSIRFPKIRTKATDLSDGDHTIDKSGNVAINDVVKYKNLTPGQKYTIEGVLMNKSTKKPVSVNGHSVTATGSFTAKKSFGSATVTFKFNTQDLKTMDLVVFEKLYVNGKKKALVASHEDINDKSQTVHLKHKGIPKTIEKIKKSLPSVKTGDNPLLLILLILGLGASALGIVLLRRRRAL